MPRLLSLSRAARLVGTTRGKLQKQVQDGDISSFEGKVRLSDLHALYPQAQLEDTAMLDRVEEIIERARFKARNRTPLPTDRQSLLARATELGDELALAKLDLSNYAIFIQKLKSQINKLKETATDDTHAILEQLATWLKAEQPHATEQLPSQNQLLVQDTMLRLVTAQVHILPSGHEYLLEGNNTLLEAGLSAGFALDYGCSNGNCGKCKAKLISGKLKKTRNYDYCFSEAEKFQNYFLTCSNTALTDLIIEADEAGSSQDIPLQSISTKVRKLEHVNDKLAILNLKTPRTNRLRFLAGQHARLIIDDDHDVQLPIASCPCDDMNIQFHIPVGDGQSLFDNIKTNDEVRLEGPGGDFILDDDASNPVVLIAQDTGFAPVKSLAEHALTLAHAESVHLLWFATADHSHYLKNLCRAWTDAFDSFNYMEYSLPAEVDVDSYSGELTSQLNMATGTIPDLDRSHVYIAGSKKFVTQCREYFSHLNIPRLLNEIIK